ncbi:Uncharacterized protein Adt_29781 [Abeliophyllum distichum]|uniref:Uncharacterized protein n=1 Tax=Abeliophyllum distichum TaxID=126358 RepID=A0ABD1R9D3_9LAMI
MADSKISDQISYAPPLLPYECPYPCLPTPIATSSCPPPPSPTLPSPQTPRPPSSGSTEYPPPPRDVYFPFYPPPDYYFNYYGPPPPDPILPYFPFYYKNPLPSDVSSAADVNPLMAWIPATTILLYFLLSSTLTC